RVVARVVAEGALEAALAGVHVALEHDLGLGRRLEVDRPARHHLDAPPAEPAREDNLVHARRQRRAGRVDQRGIAAEGDRDGHHFSGVPGAGADRGWRAGGAVWLRRSGVPGAGADRGWRAGGAVWLRRSGVPGAGADCGWPAGGAVWLRPSKFICEALVLGAALVGLPVHAEGPIVEDLEPVHPDVARAGARVPGEHARQRDVAAAVLGPAAEHRHVGALNALEEERHVPLARPLRDAIGDLRDLEVARDGDGHPAEAPGLLEAGDELPEVAERAHSR